MDITIILTPQGNAAALSAALGPLETQTHPAGRFEIVVVDGADAISDFVERYAVGAPVLLRYLRSAAANRAQAWNRGVAAAQGDWIVLLDTALVADAELAARYAEAAAAYGPEAVLVGRIALHPQRDPRTFPRWLRRRSLRKQDDGTPLHFRDWRARNLCLPKRLIEEAGGFNERDVLPEFSDVELAARLNRLGSHGYLCKSAQAYYWNNISFPEERARQYRIGYALRGLLEKVRPEELEDSSAALTALGAQWAGVPLSARTCRSLAERGASEGFPSGWLLDRSLAQGFYDARRGGLRDHP